MTEPHPYAELSAEQILELIPREELHALLAGAADRLHSPAVPDDIGALRARLEHLRAGLVEQGSCGCESSCEWLRDLRGDQDQPGLLKEDT